MLAVKNKKWYNNMNLHFVGDILKQILKYMKNFKFAAIASVIFTFINNALQLLLPAMMSLIINNGITNGAENGGVEYIKKIGFYMILASFLALVIAFFSSYYSSKASTGFAKDLRRAIFVKIESLSQNDIDKITTSSLITRSTNDVRQIENMILNCIRMLMSSLIMLIGGAVMALTLNPTLTGVLFAVIPLILLIGYIVLKKIVPLYDIVQKYTDKLNQVLREKIAGIRVIRAFNKTEYEDSRFKSANNDLTNIMLKINRIYALLIPIGSIIIMGVVVLIVFINERQIQNISDLSTPENMEFVKNTVGNLQAFIIYMFMIIAAITMIVTIYVFIPKAMISINRINEVLNLNSNILDPEDPKDCNQNNIVEFKNVSYTYSGTKEKVLTDISFTANPGKVTAIIGGTGSGKSTIINLIPRFYDVTDGQVIVGGVNVKETTQHQLREKIAIIPQTAVLFSGTIADNLKYGKEDATEEEMWEALEIAQAKDFVEKLPDGLNSYISQGGKNLSGGQKQRLAIARAIIKKADIYIFDDSFSALDFKTDALLRTAIRKSLKNSTLIIVAQRIGTIIDADKIIVLNDGIASGIGTHKELSENCTEYIEIMQSQLTTEDLA